MLMLGRMRTLVFLVALLDWLEECSGFGAVLAGSRVGGANARATISRMLDIVVPQDPATPAAKKEELPDYMKCAP